MVINYIKFKVFETFTFLLSKKCCHVREVYLISRFRKGVGGAGGIFKITNALSFLWKLRPTYSFYGKSKCKVKLKHLLKSLHKSDKVLSDELLCVMNWISLYMCRDQAIYFIYTFLMRLFTLWYKFTSLTHTYKHNRCYRKNHRL